MKIIDTFINEIQRNGFIQIQQELKEKEEIKNFIQSNIESQKIFLNRIKLQIQHEAIKSSKIPTRTEIVMKNKNICGDNLKVQNELKYFRKEIDEVLKIIYIY